MDYGNFLFFSQENKVNCLDVRKFDKTSIIKDKDLIKKIEFDNNEIPEINDVFCIYNNKIILKKRLFLYVYLL